MKYLNITFKTMSTLEKNNPKNLWRIPELNVFAYLATFLSMWHNFHLEKRTLKMLAKTIGQIVLQCKTHLMNRHIRLIWLKWRSVDLWDCRQESIVDSLKIQRMSYKISKRYSLDVTLMWATVRFGAYNSPSNLLLLLFLLSSFLPVVSESRLTGPFIFLLSQWITSSFCRIPCGLLALWSL